MKIYMLSHYDKYEGDTVMKVYRKFPTFRDLKCFRNIYGGEGLSRDEIYALLDNKTTGRKIAGYKIDEVEVEEN